MGRVWRQEKVIFLLHSPARDWPPGACCTLVEAAQVKLDCGGTRGHQGGVEMPHLQLEVK